MRRSPTLDATAILAGVASSSRTEDAEDPNTATILDAARALLARHGLGRWSMDDVASRAGVGRATVYRRFTSREDLVNATIARDLQRFFATVAEAVSGVPGLTDKVVEGFIVGIHAARATLFPELFLSDAPTAVSLLNSAPVIDLGREALVRQYRAVTGQEPEGPARAEVELVAEALIRLALSFLMIPGSSIDFDDENAARSSVRRLVGPLLGQ